MSEGNPKQAEPEGKTPSQVRLKWEARPEFKGSFCVIHMTLCGVVLVVDRFYQADSLGKDRWLGSLSAGVHETNTFDTKEEAQLWCEAKLTELLQKDLKSLGGTADTERLESADAESQLLEDLVFGWKELLEHREAEALTVSEVLTYLEVHYGEHRRLYDAVVQICHIRDGKLPSPQVLARTLNKYKGRPIRNQMLIPFGRGVKGIWWGVQMHYAKPAEVTP